MLQQFVYICSDITDPGGGQTAPKKKALNVLHVLSVRCECCPEVFCAWTGFGTTCHGVTRNCTLAPRRTLRQLTRGLTVFCSKNLFARCKYTHFSTGQYKIVPVQPIYLQNTRCARGHGATPSGDGRYSSEKMA
jgi:hypothetical protein